MTTLTNFVFFTLSLLSTNVSNWDDGDRHQSSEFYYGSFVSVPHPEKGIEVSVVRSNFVIVSGLDKEHLFTNTVDSKIVGWSRADWRTVSHREWVRVAGDGWHDATNEESLLIIDHRGPQFLHRDNGNWRGLWDMSATNAQGSNFYSIVTNRIAPAPLVPSNAIEPTWELYSNGLIRLRRSLDGKRPPTNRAVPLLPQRTGSVNN